MCGGGGGGGGGGGVEHNTQLTGALSTPTNQTILQYNLAQHPEQENLHASYILDI